jgi:hypothetical protein
MANEYRDRAAECLHLAHGLKDPQQRAILREMARAWLRLSDQAEKNSQADLSYKTAPDPPSVSQQPQQQQQQQQRTKPED